MQVSPLMPLSGATCDLVCTDGVDGVDGVDIVFVVDGVLLWLIWLQLFNFVQLGTHNLEREKKVMLA